MSRTREVAGGRFERLVYILKIYDRFCERLSLLFGYLAAGGAAVLMFVVIATVGGRLIGKPVTGGVEIAVEALVIIAFLAMPIAARRNAHIRSSLLLDRLKSPRSKALVVAIGCTIGIICFILIAWISLPLAMEAWQSNEYSGEGALRVPTWPGRFTIHIVSLLMVMELVAASFRAFQGDY